jgi:hypothetical protein
MISRYLKIMLKKPMHPILQKQVQHILDQIMFLIHVVELDSAILVDDEIDY